MKNYFYFLTVFAAFSLFVSCPPATAQVDIQWDKTFTANGYDVLHTAVPTAAGGYLLAGESDSDALYDKSEGNKSYRYSSDYWVICTNAQGKKLWDRTFGGDDFDILTTVLATADGGYLLGGYSASGIWTDKSEESRGGFDYWIIKVDRNGHKQWDKTYGGTGDEELHAVVTIADGGYLLAGSSDSEASGEKSGRSRGGKDYWVISIDKNGRQLWDKTYGGSEEDKLVTVIAAADGSYLLAGTSASPATADKSTAGRGAYDYWLVGIDRQGNKRWDKTLGGKGYEDLTAAIATADGGYLLAGASNSQASEDKTENFRGKTDYSDFWVVKVDGQGKKLWDRTYGGYDSDEPASVVSSSDGGYLLAGYSYSDASADKSENAKGMYDYWLVKTDGNGHKQWDQTIGGDMEDAPASIIPASEGGYLLAGASGSGASGDKSEGGKGVTDYWIVRVVETASQVAVKSLTLINADTDKDIATLRDGDVIDLSALENPALGIRVNTAPQKVGEVRMELSGPMKHIHTERYWPYSLYGDKPGRDYAGKSWLPGNYTLTVTPFDKHMAGEVFTISFSVVGSETASQGFSVEVYPVPSAGTVNISHAGAAETGSLTLLDFHGNVLLTRSMSASATQTVETLELSHLKKGFYYLRVVSADRVETRRLILE